ncbi:hypothetical protein N9C83_00800 [Opitutales bacterium]|nr:hypothetical protein [Opitutales bacterium]
MLTSTDTNTFVSDIADLNQFYRLRLDIPNTTVALGHGTGEVSLGLSAPPNPENKSLSISLTQLPTNGTIRKKDGTVVTVDTILTIAELLELTFTLTETAEAQAKGDDSYSTRAGGPGSS